MAILNTSTDQYLTHYWPICDGQMLDQIGSSHMTQGNLTSFTADRFGCSNSALALNGGWTQVPSGVYFDSPEFTISVWIFPQQIGSYSRIIDFGNGQSNNIVLTLAYWFFPKNVFQIFNISTTKLFAISSQNLTLNEWQFVVATFDGTNARLYLNGTLTANSNQTFSLPVIKRTNCYIGKSSWAQNGYSWSYLDDLRFYNKGLSQNEILQIMNQNQTSRSFVFIHTAARYRFWANATWHIFTST